MAINLGEKQNMTVDSEEDEIEEIYTSSVQRGTSSVKFFTITTPEKGDGRFSPPSSSDDGPGATPGKNTNKSGERGQWATTA